MHRKSKAKIYFESFQSLWIIFGDCSQLSLYLIRELPWKFWQPDDDDFKLLKQCLLDYQVSSLENQCARLVLSSLNYNFGPPDPGTRAAQLHLSWECQRKVACLIVAAYEKQVAPYLPGAAEAKNWTWAGASGEFDAWCWKNLRKLRLHVLHQPAHIVSQFSKIS
jgi:hypothetical protein